jgi:hypothetical protein
VPATSVGGPDAADLAQALGLVLEDPHEIEPEVVDEAPGERRPDALHPRGGEPDRAGSR